jgi:hypothetical protein
VRHHCGCPYKYFGAHIKGMLGFVVNNVYVVFGDQVFQHLIGIAMDTDSAPLLEDLFSCSYEAKVLHKLLQDNNKN